MIKKIKEEDLTNVMTLWVKGNFKANNFIDKDYWLEIYNNTKENFLKDYKTFVYKENDEILGFISIDDSEIKAINVRDDQQRRGIGTKLVNYCKENIYESEIIIKIFEKNMNAIIFFSNLEFKNIKIQLNEKFNEKEYVMQFKNNKKVCIGIDIIPLK